MGSNSQQKEVLKSLRDSEYEKRKGFYKCTYPNSRHEPCSYIGSLSEVICHLSRHINMPMYTCRICNRDIYDQIEVHTHKDISNRSCAAGPQNMTANVPHRDRCVDWWRTKNVYIMTVEEADYKYFKAKQADIMMLESGRGPPGTPGYDDDLPASVAPPPQNRNRSVSRAPEAYPNYPTNRFSDNNRTSNYSQQGGNFPQRHQSTTRGGMSDAPSPNSNRPWYRNRQTGKSPGPSNYQPRYSDTQGSRPNQFSGPSFPNRHSFTPSNRSFAHNSRQDAQNEQSSSRPRTEIQPSSGYRRSPSPEIVDITPAKRTHESRARSPIACSSGRESSSTAAPLGRGREASQAPRDEPGSGTVSLEIKKPREMTRHRRSSVNYRSPASHDYYGSGKDLEEISRNQQRFQVEARGTARVVPNRNRMAALLDPTLAADWVPEESQTVKRRRIEKLARSRAREAANAQSQANQPSTSTAYQSGPPPAPTQGNVSPTPVPPPQPVPPQQSNYSGFRRSPPS